MKKIILWAFLVIIVVGLGFVAWHFFSPYKKLEPISAVPHSSIFVVETQNSYKMWEQLAKSQIWAVLRNHNLFSKAGEGMDAIDTIVRGNHTLAEFVGSRNLVMSMHLVTKYKYDFLYVIDLRRASKILPVKDILQNFLPSEYQVNTNEYNGNKIFTILKIGAGIEPINISFTENLMLASFSKDLVKGGLDQVTLEPLIQNEKFKIIRDKISNKGLMQFYINYTQINDYLNTLLTVPDPNIKQLSKSLCFTGLSFNIDNDEIIRCDGFTTYNDTIPSSFRAMVRSGNGKTSISKYLPMQTASSVSLGFDRFTLYFENIITNLKEVPKSYDEYDESIKQAEKFLKINVKENLMSWIGDEAAMVHLAPMGIGKSNEFVVFLKARNISDARKNLDFVANQVRKRTPVKFNEVEYKGYYINYLSMKGFFKLLLGKFFQKLDKPYYVFIDDYVVFSNHPQSLKVVIDGVVDGKNMAQDDNYKKFQNNFNRRSNVFAVINTPQFLKSLEGTVNRASWANFEQNKDYLLCFPYIGFQFSEEGKVFETKLLVEFKNIQNTDIEDADDLLLLDTLALTDTTGTISSAVVQAIIEDILKNVDSYISDDPNSKFYSEKYPDGKIKVEFEMKDGFRHGDYREFYENGKIKVKGQYTRDHKDGTWRIYDEDGKLLRKLKYQG